MLLDSDADDLRREMPEDLIAVIVVIATTRNVISKYLSSYFVIIYLSSFRCDDGIANILIDPRRRRLPGNNTLNNCRNNSRNGKSRRLLKLWQDKGHIRDDNIKSDQHLNKFCTSTTGIVHMSRLGFLNKQQAKNCASTALHKLSHS